MKVFKGTILTVNSEDAVERYLVEDAGRIVFTGRELPARFADAEQIDLGGRALCPSFVDTHEHLASFATFNAGLNVMSARSNAEICEMIGDFRKRSDARVLIAFGASPYSVAEGRLVSRTELDAVCPDRPLMLVKYDGHACVVNTPLLKLLDAKLHALRGYHPDSGEMNQEAFFAVSEHITKSLSIFELVENVQRAMDYLAGKGIGMVHDVSGVGFTHDLDISLERWLAKSAQSGFQVRIFAQSMDVSVATRRRLPRIGGCFACALDGCFGSQDAALLEPYANAGWNSTVDVRSSADTNAQTDVEGGQAANKGVLYYSDDQVKEFCQQAHSAGLQIEMHAIGDAAFEQAASCLKQAMDADPRADARHGIIHACLPTAAGLDMCAQYGIHLPMQASFIGWPQEPDSYLERLLGPERAARLNPLRDIWDRKIVISFGSDAPCTDPDPVLWMQRACNHSNPAQSLTVREALRACTYNGAWTTFDERERGSLEAGKIADMAVLSENPYAMEQADLGKLKVEGLILQGEPYMPQRQGVGAALLRGMFGRGNC